MYEENAVNEAQEQVVDAQTPAEVTSEVEAQPAQVTTESEPAAEPPAKVPQTQEENSRFAQIRRQYEQMLKKQKQESDAELERYSGLMNTLKGMGYEGSAAEVEDQIKAQQQGVTVEQIREQRANDQARAKQMMQNDPEYRRLQQVERDFQELQVERFCEQDLATLKKAFPDMKESHIFELGDDYMRLRANQVSPIAAYNAAVAAKAAVAKPVPPEIGAVNGTETKDSEYYTNEELDALTEKQLKDPKILAKARKSMEYLFGPK